jgi:hypothetical protein
LSIQKYSQDVCGRLPAMASISCMKCACPSGILFVGNDGVKAAVKCTAQMLMEVDLQHMLYCSMQPAVLLQVFVESLVVGGPRQLMLMEGDVQRGPYKAGQPATHMGKILYPQCRKTGVWCV